MSIFQRPYIHFSDNLKYANEKTLRSPNGLNTQTNLEDAENSDFTNVCVFASLRLFAYLSPTGEL